MACFIVTTAEAVITTALTKAEQAKEAKNKENQNIEEQALQPIGETKVPFSRKLGWLNKLLWGGSLLLAFEHIWHGEVIPVFPFLTGAANPAEMLHEMATTGVAMAVLVTVVWFGMVLVSNRLEKKELHKQMQVTKEGSV